MRIRAPVATGLTKQARLNDICDCDTLINIGVNGHDLVGDGGSAGLIGGGSGNLDGSSVI